MLLALQCSSGVQETLDVMVWLVRAAFPQKGSLEGWGKKERCCPNGGYKDTKGAESSTASERGKNTLFLGKRQRREYGEIKPIL